MTCSQCRGIEKQFDSAVAEKERKRYRKKGPSRTTRMLLEALGAEGVERDTLLDIGGGIGAIQFELLDSGVSRAVGVDASQAYIDVCRDEASERGVADRISHLHGDFVDRAAEVAPASIVTLDRVVCCYHDAEALLDRSAARAEDLLGLVYPRNTWWIRLVGAGINAVSRLRRSSFRFFVHPSDRVDAAIRAHGLELRSRRTTPLWQIVVYGREETAT